jgi:phage terminase large subunit-like protein
MFSAEEPERLRGPQFEKSWADEICAWKYDQDTWDMLQFTMRLGRNPQICITTTPKPRPLIRALADDPNTVITRGSTFDNKENLSNVFLEGIENKYKGTRLGQQELYAVLLDEAEGALWSRQMLEDATHDATQPLPEMKRIVVAVDPAVSNKTVSNLTGIVVAGIDHDNVGYVLDDCSARLTPQQWAGRVVQMYEKWDADRIVAEGNQGGEMVRSTIQTAWAEAPIKIVHASRGKAARAEPVAALYEQGRIKHMRVFEELEQQMVTWEPLSGEGSPDRLDAMVWAFTDLMLKRGQLDIPSLSAIQVGRGKREEAINV